jgi:hypothetical protein
MMLQINGNTKNALPLQFHLTKATASRLGQKIFGT